MLRHAAWLRPTAVTLTGSVAVAAMTATALTLFHAFDATIMILIWNLGMAAVIAGLAGAFGQSALRWVASRVMPTLPPQLSGRR